MIRRAIVVVAILAGVAMPIEELGAVRSTHTIEGSRRGVALAARPEVSPRALIQVPILGFEPAEGWAPDHPNSEAPNTTGIFLEGAQSQALRNLTIPEPRWVIEYVHPAGFLDLGSPLQGLRIYVWWEWFPWIEDRLADHEVFLELEDAGAATSSFTWSGPATEVRPGLYIPPQLPAFDPRVREQTGGANFTIPNPVRRWNALTVIYTDVAPIAVDLTQIVKIRIWTLEAAFPTVDLAVEYVLVDQLVGLRPGFGSVAQLEGERINK